MSVRRAAAIALYAGALACVPDSSNPPSAGRSALTRGDPVDGSFQAVVRIAAGTGCTGTLLTNDWVITAAHCVSGSASDPGSVRVFYGGTRSQPEQSAVAREIVGSSAALNLALVRIDRSSPPPATEPNFIRRSYPIPVASRLIGQSVSCVGWGITDASMPPPEQPSWAALMVASATGPLVRLRTNARGQGMAAGDAGAGCFTTIGGGTFLVAVMVGADGTGDSVAVDLARPEVRAWLEASMMARGPDIAADAISPPALLLNDGGAVTVFWIDEIGAVRMKVDPGSDPSTSFGYPAGDPFSPSAPAAALLDGNLHVIGRAESGTLYERVRTSAGGTTPWTAISDADVAAASLGVVGQDGRFDLFALSKTGTVRQATFANGQWWPWDDLGGSMFDQGVTVVTFEYARIDAFPFGNGRIWHSWSMYDTWPGGWGGEVDGVVASPAALVTTGASGFDMFVRTQAGHLARRWFAWTWIDTWIDVGLALPGPPAAVLVGGKFHIYATNPDGSIWHAYTPR